MKLFSLRFITTHHRSFYVATHTEHKVSKSFFTYHKTVIATKHTVFTQFTRRPNANQHNISVKKKVISKC